jgi:hypothetical protein
MPLYRIAWKTDFGFEGHGDSISYAEASAWIEDLNRRYTDIRHWIESIESIESSPTGHCRPDSAARGPDTHT